MSQYGESKAYLVGIIDLHLHQLCQLSAPHYAFFVIPKIKPKVFFEFMHLVAAFFEFTRKVLSFVVLFFTFSHEQDALASRRLKISCDAETSFIKKFLRFQICQHCFILQFLETVYSLLGLLTVKQIQKCIKLWRHILVGDDLRRAVNKFLREAWVIESCRSPQINVLYVFRKEFVCFLYFAAHI